MIFVDESTVKVGGVTLPGLFKSLEIKTPALVEEQDVEGKTAKPKQAIGYEDAKVDLELILEDSPNQTKLEKLAIIQNLFRRPGQTKPIVYDIVNEHTAARGVSKVIFKDLITKEQSKKSEMSVSIEFWEYIPMTIKATKTSTKTAQNKSQSTTSTGNTTPQLNEEYRNYLPDRGAAPKVNDKTSQSPATDNAQDALSRNRMAAMPY